MRTAVTVLSLTLIGCAPIAAQAEPRNLLRESCAFRDDITRSLSVRHGETQRSWGLDIDGMVLEFWAADSGTWTILRTSPKGFACVMGVGDGAIVPPADIKMMPWRAPVRERSA